MANLHGGRQRRLRARQPAQIANRELVFLGSLVETKWLAAGDHVRIEIEELGEAETDLA